MDCSIIIVNFGDNDYVLECLNTLICNTKSIDYEIILVNNLVSEYQIRKIESTFLNKCNLKLINNFTNVGFSKANNQAIRIATGTYLLFLNNDTLFIENSIKMVYDFVNKSNTNVIVGCKLLNVDKSHQVSVGKFDNLLYLFSTNFFIYKIFPKSKKINKYYLNFHDLNSHIKVDFVKGAFIFISANNMQRLNGFDESFYFYGEETDLCYRFIAEGGEVCYYPDTSIIHIGGATTDTMLWFKFKNQAISKLLTYKRQFKKNAYYFALLFHYSGLILRIPIYLFWGLIGFKRNLIIKSYFYLKQLFIFPKSFS